MKRGSLSYPLQKFLISILFSDNLWENIFYEKYGQNPQLAILKTDQSTDDLLVRYGSTKKFDDWMAQTQKFWNGKLDTLRIQTGDPCFDGWMRWVSCQPILRRLFGNSFLPYHDYGRGGRGWRDLWQDILALLLMEPSKVDQMLLGNFAGVRIDGSNATIIGTQPGEFKADRNEIPRVWMDHGAWPLLTIKLYIDQTGDLGFLLREQTYFKDHLAHWTKAADKDWKPEHGTQLQTTGGDVYQGTVLEHLLVQQLTAFFNIGERNNLRLEDADWNDGLDMAPDKGESVAFTAFYASNLRQLADLVLQLKSMDIDRVHLASEVMLLLDRLGNTVDYGNPIDKRERLAEYFTHVKKKVSGERDEIPLEELATDLHTKAEHLFAHLRENEWVQDDQGHGWFNGYYDNDGQPLEGMHPRGVRMTLTGQVFALMGGIATDEQAQEIVKAVDHYLYDPKVGGYRLNTDFREVMLNMGRAFGFAYGHKENGAMSTHMAVMYASALYQRGFVDGGFKVLDAIYRHSVDFPTSRIYPGIPEYFNDRGRGMYPYLTDSASWYLLTMMTDVFGVQGSLGDLVLHPRLLKEQFDHRGEASIHTIFASRKLHIRYLNPLHKAHEESVISELKINGKRVEFESTEAKGALIKRDQITSLSPEGIHSILVSLEKYTT